MKNRDVLLTGATGIMGSWVMGEALARGYRPVVLMRDRDHKQARERIATVLDHVGRSDDVDNVRILLGNAGKTCFGLSDPVYSQLRRSVGMLIHCAACTSFSPDQDAQCWSTNVGGVRNVLDFVSHTDIALHHVSTAYLAGKRPGRVYETELSVGQEFSNTYEKSKCEAEMLIQNAFDTGIVKGSIFRPSIIVGSSKDGRILQFMNFYNLLRVIDLLMSRRQREHTILRMVGTPEGTKNLIPVDWAVGAMWHIIEREGASGEVYHLTNPNPMRHGEMQVWVNALLADNRVQMDLVDSLDGDATSLEALFEGRFANYRPYMHGEPVFDRTNTDRALDGAYPFPPVNETYFALLMAYARENGWRSIFERRTTRRTEAPVAMGQQDPSVFEAVHVLA